MTSFSLPTLCQIPLNKSGSTLLWPQQHCLGKQAWQWWKHAIRHLYCKTNSKILWDPLGDWCSSTFNMDWIWHWVICPTSHWLYFWASPEGSQWHQYSPISICQTYLSYSWDCSVVCPSPPFRVTPVTSLESKNGKDFYISLPVLSFITPNLLPTACQQLLPYSSNTQLWIMREDLVVWSQSKWLWLYITSWNFEWDSFDHLFSCN